MSLPAFLAPPSTSDDPVSSRARQDSPAVLKTMTFPPAMSPAGAVGSEKVPPPLDTSVVSSHTGHTLPSVLSPVSTALPSTLSTSHGVTNSRVEPGAAVDIEAQAKQHQLPQFFVRLLRRLHSLVMTRFELERQVSVLETRRALLEKEVKASAEAEAAYSLNERAQGAADSPEMLRVRAGQRKKVYDAHMKRLAQQFDMQKLDLELQQTKQELEATINTVQHEMNRAKPEALSTSIPDHLPEEFREQLASRNAKHYEVFLQLHLDDYYNLQARSKDALQHSIAALSNPDPSVGGVGDVGSVTTISKLASDTDELRSFIRQVAQEHLEGTEAESVTSGVLPHRGKTLTKKTKTQQKKKKQKRKKKLKQEKREDSALDTLSPLSAAAKPRRKRLVRGRRRKASDTSYASRSTASLSQASWGPRAMRSSVASVSSISSRRQQAPRKKKTQRDRQTRAARGRLQASPLAGGRMSSSRRTRSSRALGRSLPSRRVAMATTGRSRSNRGDPLTRTSIRRAFRHGHWGSGEEDEGGDDFESDDAENDDNEDPLDQGVDDDTIDMDGGVDDGDGVGADMDDDEDDGEAEPVLHPRRRTRGTRFRGARAPNGSDAPRQLQRSNSRASSRGSRRSRRSNRSNRSRSSRGSGRSSSRGSSRGSGRGGSKHTRGQGGAAPLDQQARGRSRQSKRRSGEERSPASRRRSSASSHASSHASSQASSQASSWAPPRGASRSGSRQSSNRGHRRRRAPRVRRGRDGGGSNARRARAGARGQAGPRAGSVSDSSDGSFQRAQRFGHAVAAKRGRATSRKRAPKRSYYTLHDVDPDVFNAALSDEEKGFAVPDLSRPSRAAAAAQRRHGGTSTSRRLATGTFVTVGGKYKFVPSHEDEVPTMSMSRAHTGSSPSRRRGEFLGRAQQQRAQQGRRKGGRRRGKRPLPRLYY